MIGIIGSLSDDNTQTRNARSRMPTPRRIPSVLEGAPLPLIGPKRYAPDAVDVVGPSPRNESLVEERRSKNAALTALLILADEVDEVKKELSDRLHATEGFGVGAH